MKIALDAARLDEAVRAGYARAILAELATEHGIKFAHEQEFVTSSSQRRMAMDATAQSQLVTVGSAAIPAFLVNWLDPKVIEMAVTPMKGALITDGDVLKGDWIDETAMFITAEQVGQVASYGDFDNSASSNVNVNYPQRQNYIFQSHLQYGQLEVARASRGRIDWVSQQQKANALTLAKFLNDTYFYGVANLQNYGLLNDASLPAPLAPTFSWLTSSSATANTIYQDVVRLYTQLVTQTKGVVEVNMESRFKLVLSPRNETALKDVTQYNTNSVEVLLKENFPNLEIVTAYQYSTSSGELVQLILQEYEGQKTVETAFSSKLMAHMMVTETSGWKQKRSSGSWGAIWYRPIFCAQMLG